MLACLLAVVPAQSPELQARVDAATATARASIALRPTDASAHRELSGIYEKHKFIRAASSAFAAAIALEPRDGEGYQKLAYLRKRSGDPEGALAALKTAEALLPTSGQVLVDLASLESGPDHEQTLRRAVRVAPDLTSAYHMLARTLAQGGAGRFAEVEHTYQSLMRFDPASAARRLYDFLYMDNRRVEAAVSFKRAKLAIEAMGLPRSTDSSLEAWSRYVDELTTSAPSAPRKCVERACIQGLEKALQAPGEHAAVAEGQQDGMSVLAMIGAERPEPTVLRAAAEGWGPMLRWDGEYLEAVAGEEPLEITVVTEAGAFEVRQDHIWRPPKSTMKLGDLTRLLRLQTDANLTLYSRQAPLWPMSGLLADLAPLPWMAPLRLNDLNVWLGDGHFRNTLHNDPYDNFLCQVRGHKHLLLYPPESTPDLYYNRRRDVQASYLPGRGEYNRRDTGIISDNTAEINGAAPDLEAFPLFARALKAQSYAHLKPSDCLYLPRGWHHHVFSEADPVGGYNLALNIWVSREVTLDRTHADSASMARFPTLQLLLDALHEADAAPAPAVSGAGQASVSEGACTVGDG